MRVALRAAVLLNGGHTLNHADLKAVTGTQAMRQSQQAMHRLQQAMRQPKQAMRPPKQAMRPLEASKTKMEQK